MISDKDDIHCLIMNYCKAWARHYDQGELYLNSMHALVSSICMHVQIEAQAFNSCIILTWPQF